MKKVLACIIVVLLMAMCLFTFAACSPSKISVDISKDNLGVDISQDLYGLFIEDISYACDGGLVSNMIANTSFDYEAAPLTNWVIDGLDCKIDDVYSMNANNRNYLTVKVDKTGSLLNKGYVEYYKYLSQTYKKGLSDIPDMGFTKDAEYEFACYIWNIDFAGSATIRLYSEHNTKVETINIPEKGSGWVRVSQTIKSEATEDGGLLIELTGSGTLCMDAFELVDKSSYGYDDSKWQYVSLRKDLYNALKDLNPSFIRFPGGCLAEGTTLDELYNWKETIGPLCERKHYSNIWNDNEGGLTYDNTNSMGYHEYFQLCEDLNAKALPILNAGMVCQFQMKKDGKKYRYWEKQYKAGKMSEEEWIAYINQFALVPGTAEFDAYVQDILDLIEYANGDTSTLWGARRSANGHNEPFNLQYIGIGNENWGELYWRNFDAIYKAVKEKYPDIKIISSAGPWFNAKEKDENWSIIDAKYPDTLVDEHYYTENNQMFNNNDYYDSYSRDREVFVGEYATWCQFFGKYITRNNLWAAIEEASYMCGFERNGDVVKMASYAPTFAKVNAQNWEVNMIWFDSQNIVLTPNYYTQLLYSNNYGKQVINTEVNASGCYSVTSVDQDKKIIYFKIVNTNSTPIHITLNTKEFGKINKASMQYLTSNSKAACNEIGSTTVVPQERECVVLGDNVLTSVAGYSVNIVRIAYGANDGSNFYQLPDMPSNMDHNVTNYTKPYLTQNGFIAICIIGGLFVLGFLGGGLIIVLRKKGIIKFN